jgi:hypothetical protein
MPGLPAEAGAAPATPHTAGQRTHGARRPSRPYRLRVGVQKKEGSLKNWLQGGGCSPINPLVLFILITIQKDELPTGKVCILLTIAAEAELWRIYIKENSQITNIEELDTFIDCILSLLCSGAYLDVLELAQFNS